MNNYFETLGLSPGASPEEVKKAYRSLAIEHHPDHGGDEEKFKKITEAYEIISGKRNAPDSAFQWEQQYDDAINEMFQKMGMGGFGFRKQPSAPPRHEKDIRASFDVSLEEIQKGKEFNIEYDKSIPCQKCGGKGGKDKKNCNKCNGAGQIGTFKKQGNMVMTNFNTCPDCSGRGILVDEPCGQCQAHGYTVKKERMKFEIREKEKK